MVDVSRWGRMRPALPGMKNEYADGLREMLRGIETALSTRHKQLVELRGEIAGLRERRRQLRAELASLKTAVIAEDDLAKESVINNIMIRADQGMTTPEIARAMGRSEAFVTKAIADFRRAQGQPKGARRRQPLPERRMFT